MKKLNKEDWNEWLRTRPWMNNAVKAIIGIVLVFLLIGIVATAFRFLWSGIVLIVLIGLAVLAVSQLRQRGVKVPISLADFRYKKRQPVRAEARRKRPI
jgi:hypothetical protein